jgi:hypothetical protein
MDFKNLRQACQDMSTSLALNHVQTWTFRLHSPADFPLTLWAASKEELAVEEAAVTVCHKTFCARVAWRGCRGRVTQIQATVCWHILITGLLCVYFLLLQDWLIEWYFVPKQVISGIINNFIGRKFVTPLPQPLGNGDKFTKIQMLLQKVRFWFTAVKFISCTHVTYRLNQNVFPANWASFVKEFVLVWEAVLNAYLQDVIKYSFIVNKISSGYRPVRLVKNHRRFRDSLCPMHIIMAVITSQLSWWGQRLCLKHQYLTSGHSWELENILLMAVAVKDEHRIALYLRTYTPVRAWIRCTHEHIIK